MDAREQVRLEIDRHPVGNLVRQLQGRRPTYLAGADSGASTSTTFVTTAPNVTVPATGTYLVHVQAQTNGATHVSASGAGFTASDQDGFYTPAGATGHGMFEAALTGGATLSMAFRSVDGGSRTLQRPRIALVPV